MRLLVTAAYYGIGLCSIIVSTLYVFSDLEPVAWQPDPAHNLSGAFAKNTRLSALQPILENVGMGPEDMALNPTNGRIYTAFENGDIVSFDPQAKDITDSTILVNNTQGRPLGLRFDVAGNLYVADALRGLLKIDGQGRITTLATHYNCNLLIIYPWLKTALCIFRMPRSDLLCIILSMILLRRV